MTHDDDTTASLDAAAFLAKYGGSPVTFGLLADAVSLLGDALRDRTTRIEVLEARLASLETKSGAAGVRWKGVFHEGDVVVEGELVTHAGSLWLARCTTDGRPGDSRDYTLIVKRGEAGR